MKRNFFFVEKSFLSFCKNVSKENLSSECENLLKISCQKLKLNFSEIKKNEHRKPYLKNQNFFFSFSHSSDIACCVVNKEKMVGIDIQFVNEKLLKVKSKFLNVNDFFSNENDLYKLCQAWCIKEAVFKASPKHLISLKNIFIKNQNLAEDANGLKYDLFCSYFENLNFALAVNL